MSRRQRLRRVLLLAGILPALLVAGYAIKVVLMVQDNAGGRDSFADGRYADAGSSFADTRTLNWFERWVAPFDEGTAHHADGAHAEAIADYEAALEHVPQDEECTVRINLALAHEAVGDALQEQQDGEGAVESWQAGIDVLAAGDCPQGSGRGKEQSEDAAEVDKRLRDKLQEEQQQQQQQGQGGQPPPPPGGQQPPEGEDPREERLERKNERGLEQRREDRELYEDDDYSRPFAW